ncbi:hypothetical protein F7725_004903, partial [Dissostichus mawsoni]
MEVNSSSTNESLPQPYFTFGINCYVVMPGFFQFISYGITFIFLLLPLCIFVLYLGLQRWRQQSSTSSTASTNSHSDIFTFHMVVMELLCFLGFNLCVYAVYAENYKMLSDGFLIWSFAWYVQNSFHILTCVEHMAVNDSNNFTAHSYPPWDNCFFNRPGSLIFTSAYITKILVLLPLCIFVLYLGLQRCRQRSSTSAAASTNSHSDIFTFHMVCLSYGCTLFIYAIYSANHKIFGVGSYICLFTWYGRNSCHVLTCVERYLAVVHPVTYLNLKGQRGVRIRNICIGFVWLLCLVAIIPLSLQKDVLFFHLSLMIFSLMVVAFCSLAVLRELIRPGLGEQGGDRKRVDQSKRRAFYTIVAILGVLLFRFCGNMTWVALSVKKEITCEVTTSEDWVSLPAAPQKQVTDEDMPKSSMTTMWKVKTSKGFMAAGPQKPEAQDEGGEREQEEDVGDGEDGEDGGTGRGTEAGGGVWEEFWEEAVLASMALKKRREGGEGKREGVIQSRADGGASESENQHSQYDHHEFDQPASQPRLWANQNPDDRKAAEKNHKQKEGRPQIRYAVNLVLWQVAQTYGAKTKQPNAHDGDVSDPNCSVSSQLQEDDWMHDGQVTLHTGEHVEILLSAEVEEEKDHPQNHHYLKTCVGGTAAEERTKNIHQLGGDHIVREGVRVADYGVGLLAPFLHTEVNDSDAEREEEEGEGEEVG